MFINFPKTFFDPMLLLCNRSAIYELFKDKNLSIPLCLAKVQSPNLSFSSRCCANILTGHLNISLFFGKELSAILH